MRLIVKIVLFLFLMTRALWANDLIPDRRTTLTQDLDFYGSDLRSLFDTDFQSCQRACLLDKRCSAFTFNKRSNSCFPKSAVTESKPYVGALSGRVIQTAPSVLARATTRALDLDFLGKPDFDNAKRLAVNLSTFHYAGEWDAEAWLKSARELRNSGEIVKALKFTGAALTLTDRADLWTEYARLGLSLKKTDLSHVAKFIHRALPASINAYLRSTTPAQQVAALSVMAKALEVEGRGRDMIPALSLAQKISPRDDNAKALDRAILKYGFRITEDSVDSDTALPRICAIFSRDLVQAGLDYTPYLKLPKQDMPVEVSSRQMCIGGLDHGQRYSITFRAGLPAANGETLHKPVTITHYVRDRSPVARFSGRGYVLPKSGDAALPIETVNLKTVDLVLRRVSDRNLLRAFQDGYFGRPISAWQEETFASDVAEEVWRGTGKVQMTLNKEVTTRLPMGDIIADLPAGIYALQAKIPGADPYDNPATTQWFVLSDLGLATMKGADGIHVFVRSLADASAKEGIRISLMSRANVVLAETETDQNGYAHFASALTQGTGGHAPALITATEGDKDIAFLSLTDPAFDLSDRGVTGREPAKAIDVFLTTDRGAYRAGETVYATALARDSKALALSGIPLTAVLRRPDGLEYSRKLSASDQAGGHVFTLPIGATVPRGGWRLSVYADPKAPALASTSFLVEDFLPERIDFDLSLPEGPIRVTDTPQLTVKADYLFGAPAADLAIEGEVKVQPRDGLKGFPGYVFGRYDEPFSPRSEALPPDILTNARGEAKVPVDFPEITTQSRPLEAQFTVRVSEGSGRPVERRLTQPLTPSTPMIGIKPLFDDVVSEGSNARFDLLAINEKEQTIPMRVRWTVNRVNTRYQWYQDSGNWNWEPVTTRTLVASDEVQLTDEPVEVSAPVDWGQYEIKVERLDGDYLASSTDFYAGWYVSADTSSTPDVLKVSLDKPAYKPGETATLRIVPRYAGKALITVVSNHLIDMKTMDVVKGENLISLPVTDDWGAGAYVTATVIRPMQVAAGHNPARALGLSYAPVAPGDRKLTAAFQIPPEAAPRQSFDVALNVGNVKSGETAYATIAAVDVGILNMTGFQSPDAVGHFLGQRRLGMELRDVYGRLIDGMNGAMGSVRSGGDAGNDANMQSPPPTEDLVTFFSGPVMVGPDGLAHARFDLPAFNGTLRLMAVVWSATGVGNAEADVLVRDPVVVTASLPRFLSPGDQSRMLLEITHASGPTGKMALEIAMDGKSLASGLAPSEITLGKLETKKLSVPLSASQVGTHTITVSLTTPDGKRLSKNLTLPVVDNDPEITRTSRFNLADGNTFTFSRDVFANLRAGTGSATLSVGPLARLDAPGLLNALDRYPYGCTEQVTSKAMPLLYLNDVAKVMGLDARESISKRVNQAVEKVLNNQSTNGAFGLWQPDQGDFWLDAYVGDFLSRARAKGYSVPDTAFRMAMDNLRNQVNYAGDFDSGGEDLAYALMVLAREGAAATGDLRYYADVKGDAFSTPLAAAQLGAALAYYGDQTRADAMFRRAARLIAKNALNDERYYWRADYGSVRRDAAGALALAEESGSNVLDKETLIKFITSRNRSEYRSTQEAAWTLLAAKELVKDPSMNGFTINGEPANGPLVRVVEDETTAKALHIRNGTGHDQTVTMTTFGVPQLPEPASGNGYAIDRKYYTMDGEQIDITDPAGIPVGSRMIAVVTVHPYSDTEARLMIDSPLPAGLEIDNPNLLQSADVRAFEWLNLPGNVRFSEARSDRYLAAVDWSSDTEFQLAYIVRAISPGQYHQPAASVEDMYRPEFRAHSDPATIRVTE